MRIERTRFLLTRGTTAQWNAKLGFIPLKGEIIVYTDYGKVQDEQGNMVDVPALKVGDGLAYLVDLPFVGESDKKFLLDYIKEHEMNAIIHVSQEDRERWNNKLNYDVDGEVLELNRQ